MEQPQTEGRRQPQDEHSRNEWSQHQTPQASRSQSELTEGYITQEDRFFAVNAATRFMKAYEASCKQFCRETGLTQTALDVLLFLANNPELNNACDIVAKLGFKSTHVSASVDRLVNLGFVRRDPVASDRRKLSLVVTDEAKGVVEGARAVRRSFQRRVTEGVLPEDAAAFMRIVAQVSQNIDAMETAAKKRTKQPSGIDNVEGECEQ